MVIKVKKERLLTSVDDKVDRISVLPNDALGLILSFLSLKEAVRTSTLSHQWRHKWALTRKLHLDGTTSLKLIKRSGYLPQEHQGSVVYEERCRYLRWADRLITRLTLMQHDHHHHLEEFRVLFDLSASHKQWIDDWLSYAVGRKAETLELDLINSSADEDRSYNTYRFPYREGNFPSNLRVLKVLSLHLVNVSGATVELFLGNCPFLERVSISGSQELSHLELIRTSPCFKCLEISSCQKLRSLVVRGSNIACFKYGGDSIRRFELVDVPFLTQLWIQPLSPYRFTSIATMFSSVLPQLQMLKLYVKYNISWEECARMVKGVWMRNLTELVVSINGYIDDSVSLLPVINFMSVSRRLQRFVVEASHRKGIAISDCGRFSRSIPYFYHYSRFCRDPNNLKEMEFIGYRGTMSQFELIRHVAGNFKSLEKIVIDPRGFKIKPHRPWGRFPRLNKVEEERIARAHAKEEFRTYIPYTVNFTIL